MNLDTTASLISQTYFWICERGNRVTVHNIGSTYVKKCKPAWEKIITVIMLWRNLIFRMAQSRCSGPHTRFPCIHDLAMEKVTIEKQEVLTLRSVTINWVSRCSYWFI